MCARVRYFFSRGLDRVLDASTLAVFPSIPLPLKNAFQTDDFEKIWSVYKLKLLPIDNRTLEQLTFLISGINEVYRPENATYMQPICRIVQNQVIIQGLQRLSTPSPVKFLFDRL